jgi:uncharacterized protein (DUF433 family)
MGRMNFTEHIPLTQDANGTIRVKRSRVTIDTLIARYSLGDTVEEIHEGFPTVSVEAIQKIISWYVTHQTEVDEYILKRDAEAEILRREIESQPAYKALREKLMRRKAQLTKA